MRPLAARPLPPLVLVALLALGTGGAGAQGLDPRKALTQYGLDTWTTDDDLSAELGHGHPADPRRLPLARNLRGARPLRRRAVRGLRLRQHGRPAQQRRPGPLRGKGRLPLDRHQTAADLPGTTARRLHELNGTPGRPAQRHRARALRRPRGHAVDRDERRALRPSQRPLHHLRHEGRAQQRRRACDRRGRRRLSLDRHQRRRPRPPAGRSLHALSRSGTASPPTSSSPSCTRATGRSGSAPTAAEALPDSGPARRSRHSPRATASPATSSGR